MTGRSHRVALVTGGAGAIAAASARRLAARGVAVSIVDRDGSARCATWSIRSSPPAVSRSASWPTSRSTVQCAKRSPRRSRPSAGRHPGERARAPLRARRAVRGIDRGRMGPPLPREPVAGHAGLPRGAPRHEGARVGAHRELLVGRGHPLDAVRRAVHRVQGRARLVHEEPRCRGGPVEHPRQLHRRRQDPRTPGQLLQPRRRVRPPRPGVDPGRSLRRRRRRRRRRPVPVERDVLVGRRSDHPRRRRNARGRWLVPPRASGRTHRCSPRVPRSPRDEWRCSATSSRATLDGTPISPRAHGTTSRSPVGSPTMRPWRPTAWSSSTRRATTPPALWRTTRARSRRAGVARRRCRVGRFDPTPQSLRDRGRRRRRTVAGSSDQPAAAELPPA